MQTTPAIVPSTRLCIPLVLDHNRSEAINAISQAQSAIATAQAQLACLELDNFFSQNPSILSVTFSLDYQSDDQGGQDIYGLARFTFPDDDDTYDPNQHDDLSGEICGILDQWTDKMDGESYKTHLPGMGMAAIGKEIMGAEAFDCWMAHRERVKIDQDTLGANAQSPESSRL